MTARFLFSTLAVVIAACGCQTHARSVRLGSDPTGADVTQTAAAPVEIVGDERDVVVVLDEGEAHLSASLVHPKVGRGPGVIIVPGGGDVSRLGMRAGDGVATYPAPVPVSLLWAEALAKRGAHVLSYDKRTCGPNDDARCKKNAQADVDAQGPTALAKDVDAACAIMKADPNVDGRIVLITHGQGAQVVLSSACAKTASALVLFAPIPRAVDEVIVAGLKQRVAVVERAHKAETDDVKKRALLEELSQLRNLAGTREAEFASMKAGRFTATARIAGATLAFWKGWMDSTSKTTALADAVSTPKVVAVGSDDQQYATADKKRMAALATAGFVEVAGADHHLLTHGALAPSTVDLIGAALDAALAQVPAS